MYSTYHQQQNNQQQQQQSISAHAVVNQGQQQGYDSNYNAAAVQSNHQQQTMLLNAPQNFVDHGKATNPPPYSYQQDPHHAQQISPNILQTPCPIDMRQNEHLQQQPQQQLVYQQSPCESLFPVASQSSELYPSQPQQAYPLQQPLGGGNFNSSATSSVLSSSGNSSRPPVTGFQHQPYGNRSTSSSHEGMEQQHRAPATFPPSPPSSYPPSNAVPTTHEYSTCSSGGGSVDDNNSSHHNSETPVSGSEWTDPRVPQPNVITKSRRPPPTTGSSPVSRPAVLQSATTTSHTSFVPVQQHQVVSGGDQFANRQAQYQEATQFPATALPPPPQYMPPPPHQRPQQQQQQKESYPQKKGPYQHQSKLPLVQQQQRTSIPPRQPPRHAMIYLQEQSSEKQQSIAAALPLLGQFLEIKDESQLRERLFVPAATPIVASDDFISVLHLLSSDPKDLKIDSSGSVVDVILDLIMFRWGKIVSHALEWAESQLANASPLGTVDFQNMMAQRLIDRCISLVSASPVELFEDSGSKGLAAMCSVSPRVFSSVRSFLASASPQQLLKYALCKASTEILLKCINHEASQSASPASTLVIEALGRTLSQDVFILERVALDHCGSFILQAWVSKCSFDSVCSTLQLLIVQSASSQHASASLLHKLADGVGNYPLQTLLKRFKKEEEEEEQGRKSSLDSQLQVHLRNSLVGAKHARHVHEAFFQ